MSGTIGELATCSLGEWLQQVDAATAQAASEEVAALPDCAAAVSVICGRVSHVRASEDAFLLDDGQTARWCAGTKPHHQDVADEKPTQLQAGDFVAVTLPSPSSQVQQHQPESLSWLQPVSIQLLSRPQSAGGQFPPPQGDWYRLQRDGRSRLHKLQARAQVLAATRRFFAQRGFVEIEAPLMVPSPGLELHLAAFQVQPSARYLITSPEYQLKRLLTGGMQRIYSLGKVFRHGELGPHHNPEFTMLEWYRAYADWTSVAHDVAELCAELAQTLHGSTTVRYRGQELDLTPPWPQLTVAQAVRQHTGIELRGDETTAQLLEKLSAAGLPLPAPSTDAKEGAAAQWNWDDVFFSLFLNHVEPKLFAPPTDGSAQRPFFLYDWPAPLCALARRKPTAPQVVERFEAYALGLELCNGFGELCDPTEQRQRLLHDASERQRRGLPVYPLDERFLQALDEGLPPSGGVALGIDRIVMLLLDAAQLRDVLPFSADEL